ncbi:MAG: hypothetical protein JW982_11725 [Spirochaetes bacterium]|nr:hypothetical protein [Spirochaetota bacterium]
MENEIKNSNNAESNPDNGVNSDNDETESFSDENKTENTGIEADRTDETIPEIKNISSANKEEKTDNKKTVIEKKDPEKLTISLDIRKIKKIFFITGAAVILIAAVFMLFILFQPKRYAVIKMLNGDIYRGKIILITDNKMYYQKGKDVYDDFEIAYSESLDFDISFSIENIDKIESIHYILREQKDEVPEPEVTKKPEEKYDTNIFGTYHIFLSGHEGTLYIRYKNGRVYGGVKFPNWANGVYEPLKDVRIKNGELSFTRSATTLKDIRRIGISSYFTQTFTGRLYPKTGEIKGFFTNSGARQSWHAEKIK